MSSLHGIKKSILGSKWGEKTINGKIAMEKYLLHGLGPAIYFFENELCTRFSPVQTA